MKKIILMFLLIASSMAFAGDAQLGNTTVEGGNKTASDRFRGSWFVATEAGTIDSMFAHSSGSCTYGFAVYSNNDGSRDALAVVDSSTQVETVSSGAQWTLFISAENYSFSSGDTIWIGGIDATSGTDPVLQNSTIAGQGLYIADTFPPTNTGGTGDNRYYSAYFWYTNDAGASGTIGIKKKKSIGRVR